MKKTISKIAVVAVAIIMMVVAVLGTVVPAMADTAKGLTMAPMHEKAIINPGESYQSSFRISNPVDSKESMEYELSVAPFYMSAGGEIIFEGDEIDEQYTQMVDWIKFDVPTSGKLEPNEVKEILYTITVPQNAPAGGQYAMIGASTKIKDDNTGSSSAGSNSANASINEVKRLGHLVYAEITGNTVKRGEISDMNVPSFLLDGNIKGSANIKNTGNVHGDAKYTLQVYPLFSSEEVFTNEEEPGSRTILPDRDYYAEIAWEETPGFGIFNVVFKVEFEGETQEISKMVIKAPIWLIFIVVFVIVSLVLWIVLRIKHKGDKQQRSSGTASTPSAE